MKLSEKSMIALVVLLAVVIGCLLLSSEFSWFSTPYHKASAGCHVCEAGVPGYGAERESTAATQPWHPTPLTNVFLTG